MSEKTNTIEERNESQRKTIVKQVERIEELKIWEKFAKYLITSCIGKTVTEESLEQWLEECQQPRKQ